MKYSLKWLDEMVSLEEYMENPYLLESFLHFKGIEVEHIQPHKMDLVVVGEIVDQKPHPNADSLKLCRVQISADKILPVVCGASNQKKGDKTAVCLEGAEIGSLKIKPAKIRGEISSAMLASEEELGFPQTQKGIMILPSKAPLGKRLDEYLGLKDYCLDLAIAPNRADLLSHLGMAREFSSLLNRPMKLDHLFWPSHYKKDISSLGIFKKQIESSKSLKNTLQFSDEKISLGVEIQEREMCPFYAGLVIQGICVQDSPEWLARRLRTLGINPINNIVDVTNLILQEWGQPLHAFDLSQIEGGITVKKAHAKDRFIALDDREVEFCGDELIISDDQKTLALAGVIGGKNSSISNQTKDIFIESAVFAPYAIRRMARRFKWDTDSSFYFSRGVFHQTTLLALRRACSLIQQTAGGRILKNNIQFNFFPQDKKTGIAVNQEDLSERLGYPVNMKEFSCWMDKMNCQVKKKRLGKEWMITAPYYRRDLTIKEDIIEEWARLKGYDSVRETLPLIGFQNSPADPFLLFLDKVKKTAKEQGFYQAINYSLAHSKWNREFLGRETSVFIKNPITQDLDSLRQSLLPGLFKNMLLNIRHGESWGRLFEQGVSFEKKNLEFEEIYQLSFILWGQKKTLWKTQESLFLNSNQRLRLF